MGLIANLLGLTGGVKQVAEVFVENKTARAAQEHSEHLASLQQLGAEYARDRGNWLDQLVDGINRMPRPALAMGTIGLFVYAMVDPISFGVRMQGLALIPDQLWWLLGAIVSFYFGARELHHFRGRTGVTSPDAVRNVVQNMQAVRRVGMEKAVNGPDFSSAGDNPALIEWRSVNQ